MINAIISEKNRTITLTKKDYIAAHKYGTDEYKELQEIRLAYPGFKVVKSSKSVGKKDAFKGLTFDYMEKYIKEHDDENNTKMAEFNNLRGKSKEFDELGMPTLSYGEIKAWFLTKYPAIESFIKEREKIMTSVANAKTTKKIA